MDRAEKATFIESLHRTFTQAAIVVVSHYSGLTVAQLGDLRRQVRVAGGGFKVTKNRLALRALEGTPYEGLNSLFTGPTAIAYADEPVAISKVMVGFAKTQSKLVLLGGGLGTRVLGAEDVKGLATLPSLDELRGTIVGLIQAPAQRLVGLTQAPGAQLARVLAAHAEQAGEREAA
ncbi:MAG: 50S ribosomal protein L10 [Rhodospirillales bacterium]|nr:MAG: 50S ribosomal protein L10 [Rhodospirillales bacterium]